VTGKLSEEAQASLPSEAKVGGTEKEMDKGTRKAKRARKSERLEVMRELVLAVRELGVGEQGG
jgi:hypothetical protein